MLSSSCLASQATILSCPVYLPRALRRHAPCIGRQAVLREADADHDGTISWEDFQELMRTRRDDKLEIFQSRRRLKGWEK